MQNDNDKWAEFYDELHEWMYPSECVQFLSRRISCGPVGEFAVGNAISVYGKVV